MDGGGFYRGGSSVTRSFSRGSGDHFDFGDRSGSMYEFPSGSGGGMSAAAVSGIEQKLDMVVSLVMEQKALSATIESGTNDLKGVVTTLVSDVAYLKEKVQKTAVESSPSGSARKKIPSELSVSGATRVWRGNSGSGGCIYVIICFLFRPMLNSYTRLMIAAVSSKGQKSK